MMIRNILPVAALGFVVFISQNSVFAQQRKSQAILHAENAPSSFFLQGEYAGEIESHGSFHLYGLQVIARQNRRFEGVVYSGGLPGAGWNGKAKTKLSGVLRDDRLVLFGNNYSIEVSGNAASFYDRYGDPLGQIAKVKRESITLGQSPPAEAIVLFDGTDTKNFRNGRITRDGLLKEGADFLSSYKDYDLHLEFQLPYMPATHAQRRANSGVYLQSRYEVQILDSFGLEGAFNECGSLYRFRKPDVNMCLPPLSWQTYDINFRSPRYNKDGKKTQNVKISVWHNGVLIHDNVDLPRKTGAGAKETSKLLPIKLQAHGDPVRFRNIWLIER